MSEPEEPVVQPLLRVVRGTPSAEELAALVAVVTARASQASDDDTAAPALWSAPVLRGPLPHGPGAWRSSGLPG